MPIVKPFIAGRRFVSTAATGTVAGADLTFANTDFTDDTGAVTTFPASYAFLTLYINGVYYWCDYYSCYYCRRSCPRWRNSYRNRIFNNVNLVIFLEVSLKETSNFKKWS